MIKPRRMPSWQGGLGVVLHPLAHLHWLSWVSQCQDLYAAGEKICGTDEMKFITILCTRSATHLMRGTGEAGRRCQDHEGWAPLPSY